jgi:serine/threonine protein kinase
MAAFDGPLLAGRWRLGPRLGAGGQGRTFLARDESVRAGERIVAVKQLKLGGEAGWKRFDLFEREVRVLRGLRHPGVPRFLDTFEDPPGVHHIVMEKAPGATLKAIATKARFSDDELADVMRRLLAILDYLHGRDPPVIHRDVKPANVVRDADGSLMLVDFGGVLDALRDEGGSTVVGTFGYMAPEQLHGAATPRTDLYGLGATIVALAGRVEPERVARRGLRMDLAAHLPDMAPELRRLLERMTDPDPDGRPASAKEALALLARAPARRPELAPVPARAPTPSPPPALVEDDILADDGSIPQPILFLLLLAFFVIGAAGSALFYVADVALAPLGFAIARAFRPQARARLHASESEVRASLRSTRGGFQALMSRGARGRRRALPPAGKR